MSLTVYVGKNIVSLKFYYIALVLVKKDKKNLN